MGEVVLERRKICGGVGSERGGERELTSVLATVDADGDVDPETEASRRLG